MTRTTTQMGSPPNRPRARSRPQAWTLRRPRKCLITVGGRRASARWWGAAWQGAPIRRPWWPAREMQGEQDPTDLQTSLSPPRGRPPSPAVRYRRKVLGSSPSGDPLPRQAVRVFSFSSGREVKGTLVISPFHRGWAERGAPPVRRRKCEHAAVWRPWVTQGSASGR